MSVASSTSSPASAWTSTPPAASAPGDGGAKPAHAPLVFSGGWGWWSAVRGRAPTHGRLAAMEDRRALPLLLASDRFASGEEREPLDRLRMQKGVFLLQMRGPTRWGQSF